ncbi:hypothetical protein D4R86_01865 [bacterium]|nr:MAG: hypothetical protein D4R86_01865 [bacterium]
MNFEGISAPEKERNIPKITAEEWIKHSGGDMNDEEFKAFLEAKGIEFNENDVAEVELDGQVIQTKKDDFGTIIEEPGAIIEKSIA